MQIPFLQRIQALAGPAINKVVPADAGPAATAAATQLRQVLAGLPELLGAAVVAIESGQALATYTTSREFNLPKALGHNADVVRQQRRALQALGLPAEEALEEILITLRHQLHLLRLLPNDRFLYVAVDCRDTNLGIARAVIRSCEG
ncbi:hypothetical protein [Hymenobacter canadensis]|uniref:Roadblock/LAMTOR2 domain-containing protein n=1 Tax=Hymenobacter canadensis TaxID=2999067 RepID=A0ABY7LK58_9BACT|nr:hypothetical protein [Hymenobacter canadensis]WBA40818.1 hypothetical protein O3303_13420 [Hymenobacter canadensis]